MASALNALQALGQSVWYDNIRRGLMTSGELQELIDQDGVVGVTSNPAIFEQALAGSTDYDAALDALVSAGVGPAQTIFEHLAIDDIRLAADVLAPIHRRTDGLDGFVSMEVSPYLSRDTEGTLEEARRLHRAIDRSNVMIKVPATPEGIPAIRQLITEGIHVNVTLLFAVDMYEQVAHAYIEGLEARLAAGRDVRRVASVASFFVSRLDVLVDQHLSERLAAARDAAERAFLERLLGTVAIANARIAYGRYRELCADPRWQALVGKGARPQRLLWASMSTKNPKSRDTIYVEELIGPETVSTIPAETLRAFRAHGRPRAALSERWDETVRDARETVALVERAGISMRAVTDQLLVEAVRKFADPFDTLLGSIERKRQTILGGALARQALVLGDAEPSVAAVREDWRRTGKVRRLWSRDSTVWSGRGEDRWLGWLDVVDAQRETLEHLRHVVDDVRGAGFEHVVLLGMGGSSLCPEVMARTFGPVAGAPALLVLDSTVPAQVEAVQAQIDPAKTFFVVSSKSGSTTEPNAFKQYFFDLVVQAVGREAAGSMFMAITDPDSSLQALATRDRFRHIAHGVPSIGGRYSALSSFGMMPAGLMGVDVGEFLDRTELMVQSCASSVPPDANPGVELGIALGTLASRGRDKVTFVCAPAVAALGAWLEQLLAESTGKDGKGLVPVDREEVGDPDVYGADRLFVHLRVAATPDRAQDEAMAGLERAGHPIVRVTLAEPMELGQEFFRWEMATAVAGAVLGIDPFDQPDVEASKNATRRLTAEYERTGHLAEEQPILQDDGVQVFADSRNAAAIGGGGSSPTLETLLHAHLGRLVPGDYFALNAYVAMTEAHDRALQRIRHLVRNHTRVATTLGFGPRFLHSTGQLHKGGANIGLFLQITADDAEDLPIPGQSFTFGILRRFQAQGDLEVLVERDRRVLRLHLGANVATGLARVQQAVERALAVHPACREARTCPQPRAEDASR